jgi:hypothetical protein
MLATIVLPPGTERVTLRDIPSLFADAIHPPVPEDTPRVLSYLQKEATGAKLAAQWCGRGNNFPVSLSEKDLNKLNGGVWKHLPPLALLPENDDGLRKLKSPLAEPQWEPYRAAFEAKPPKGWKLIVVWRNTVLEQWVMHDQARKDWKRLLEQQAVRGAIAPRFPTSNIPSTDTLGHQLLDNFFTVEEFTEFAGRFSVHVRVQRAFARKALASELLEVLRKEPLDENIIVTEAIGSCSGQSTWPIREWIPHLQAIAERQARGYFTVGEAAQLLTDANCSIDVKDMIGRMREAKIGTPARRLVRGPHMLPLLDGAKFREFLDLVKVEDVDDWLSSLGVPYRLAALCPLPVGSTGSLLVQVAGRDALPVRAIPYVTGWCMSPDDVAKQLAQVTGEPFARLRTTLAYFLNGGTPRKMLPKEWDRYVATLDGLEAGIRAKHKDDALGYSVWLTEAAAKLPAGVFVWRDEFEKDYQRDFSPDALTMTRERPGERELTYAPMLEDELRTMVLAGFTSAAGTAYPIDFDEVLHHLEGNETHVREYQTAEETKKIETRTFGPDRWIERVRERKIVSAVHCVALVLFAVRDFGETTNEQERQIVEAWAAELRKSAEAQEFPARDVATFLPVSVIPGGWEWGLALEDADAFVAARGMKWTCTEIAEHIFQQCERSIHEQRFPPELFGQRDWGDRREPAPIQASGQRWTPEAKAELAAYKAAHGTKKTAAHFGISEQRVRALCPSEKPALKGYSAFTHITK